MPIRHLPLLLTSAGLSLLVSCALGTEPASNKPLPDPFAKLVPLHKRMGKPAPGDWLAAHPEPGQSYEEYIADGPVKPDKKRRVIYVQLLGDFTSTQRKIVVKTAEYMQAYFNLPVQMREPLPLSVVPAKARRKHPAWGMDQILSTYVLHDVLAPRLPDDAVAYIAFTSSDLWPGEGWNFVFGQASLSERVGVWSIYRYGDPDASKEAYQLCLLRTLKVGSHETGHMFSMRHCIAYQCNMNGSNHMVEADRCPSWLCPECLAKLCWATDTDPAKHLQSLAAFCKESGLREEQAFYEKSLAALRGKR